MLAGEQRRKGRIELRVARSLARGVMTKVR